MSKPVSKVVIAGNWKMNKTRKEGRALADAVKAAVSGLSDLPEIILTPSFTCLQDVGSAIKGSPVSLAAQNMDYRDSGAYTGEISPVMLVDLDVKYVLIGHSERRQYFGETNATVNLRVKAALAHGLHPILCVGEALDERESDLTDPVIGRQVAAALADVDQSLLSKVIVAYEPVWAIGTGKNCEAGEANRVAALIRKTIERLYTKAEASSADTSKFNVDTMPVLYGGSVKSSNIDEMFKQEQIDGALIGGASLQSEEFVSMVMSGRKAMQTRFSKAPAAL